MNFNFIERHDYSRTRQSLNKILMMMKLTAFLMVITLFHVSAKGYGQITLHEKNAPLEKVMSSIRKQTNYAIVYDNSVKARTITIDIENASIQEALDKCFQYLPITYKIIGKSIFLKQKDENSTDEVKLAAPILLSTTVVGRIVNEYDMAIEGASVFVKGSTIGTLTNTKGYFQLNHIAENAVLQVSCIGYKPADIGIRKLKTGYVAALIQKEQAGTLKAETGAAVNFTLQLLAAVGDLKAISINGDASPPKQLGTVVDLKNRTHLNLAQVLEGSVPGITLKSTTSTTKELSVNSIFFFSSEPDKLYTGIEQIKELYNRVIAASPTNRSTYPTFEVFYNFVLNIASNNPIPGYVSATTITSSSGVVPELRGSSSFLGNSSGMLVVIDGIEQSSFPADYPMVNVAKIEVVKDPAELIKWGPRATGGLILITTNGAKAGRLQFNYSSNIYYSDKPNISNEKLQLASTPDILAYYREQVDKGLASYIPTGGDFSFPPTGLKPAQLLLYNLKKNGLPYTDAKFSYSWDSLAAISNRGQLRSLYQNVFRQLHSLTMTGGTQNWTFSLGGNYDHSQGEFLKSDALIVNLQNNFNFFRNKLRITWQLNTNESKDRSASVDYGNTLDPYQLLLDTQQNYIYDYPNGSFATNQEMLKLGYEHSGVNALEDALNTKNINKLSNLGSILTMNWNLSNSLQWATIFRYDRKKSNVNNQLGSASSQVRSIRNNYGSPDGSGGVTMYIPQGDILYSNHSNASNWNARSGLSYNRHFGSQHVLTGALSLAATHSQNISLPNANIYGYSSNTPQGQPLLTFPEEGVTNYFGAIQYAANLQTVNAINANYDRNLSVNGNLGYTFDDRYQLAVQYGSVFTPNVGFLPAYSATKNYQGRVSWMVNKERFFKSSLISTLTLSGIVSRIQLGKSPDLISSRIIPQPLWNNNAIYASGYVPSQFNGQSLNNMGGGLDIGLWDERLYIKANYNYTSDRNHQFNGQIAYDITRAPWFKVPFISTLTVDATIQNFNSLQAQSILMGTNLPNSNGQFGLASSMSFSILPPATLNKEAHLRLGLFKERLTFDTRYYHKIVSGTFASNLLQPDPSTGLAAQLSYSRMLNKGIELYLQGKVVQSPKVSYMVTVVGAYNTNEALDIPNVPFTQLPSYLTALRAGYATDALWSYRWAGLDQNGDPQIYRDKDTKVPIAGSDANGNTNFTQLDASSLVYSGRIKAPWSGGLTQDWTYKNFFAQARLTFEFGHVMRTYRPASGPELERHMLIGQRWRHPGDEAYTEIAAMAPFNATRTMVIQNSSNSIAPADHVRFRELQIGYDLPERVLKSKYLKTIRISAHMQNIALWKRNKLGLDPITVSSNGTVSFQEPRQYVLFITTKF